MHNNGNEAVDEFDLILLNQINNEKDEIFKLILIFKRISEFTDEEYVDRRIKFLKEVLRYNK